MHLYWPFSQETRNQFLYHQYCFKCKSNGWNRGGLELHHITGRGKFEKFKDSIFNACVLCKYCHDSILHTPETHYYLTTLTFHFLKDIRYEIKQYDKDYLIENQNYFREYFGQLVELLAKMVK